MKKLLAVALCFVLASPAARAREQTYVALIVNGGPSGEASLELLAGLEARDARATFFLRGQELAQYPEIAENMLELGHELALEGDTGDSMAGLSRRSIAKALGDTRNLMPEGARARFLCPPGEEFPDGVRQVAAVTGLALVKCRWDVREWARRDDTLGYAPVVELVQDGDLVRIHGDSSPAVNMSLAMIDRLRERGIRFVTLSELARRRGILIQPGRVYEDFGGP